MAEGCGVVRRRSLDPMLPWLWRRLAAAALIQPLAWELSYVAGAALIIIIILEFSTIVEHITCSYSIRLIFKTQLMEFPCGAAG